MKKSILVLSLVAFFVTALVAENKPVEKAKAKTETKACCGDADKKACGDKTVAKGDCKKAESKCCGDKKTTATTTPAPAKK